MRPTRRTKTSAVAAALLAMIAAGTAAGASTGRDKTEADFTTANAGRATVAQSAAEQTALTRHTGSVYDTHLEDEDGPLVWEAKVDDGRDVWEIQIDANTGTVVGDQPDE